LTTAAQASRYSVWDVLHHLENDWPIDETKLRRLSVVTAIRFGVGRLAALRAAL
jgi:hypothetical protein